MGLINCHCLCHCPCHCHCAPIHSIIHTHWTGHISCRGRILLPYSTTSFGQQLLCSLLVFSDILSRCLFIAFIIKNLCQESLVKRLCMGGIAYSVMRNTHHSYMYMHPYTVLYTHWVGHISCRGRILLPYSTTSFSNWRSFKGNGDSFSILTKKLQSIWLWYFIHMISLVYCLTLTIFMRCEQICKLEPLSLSEPRSFTDLLRLPQGVICSKENALLFCFY